MAEKKRKPGSQPGNTNALKHGFYSQRFRQLELIDLEALLSDGLQDEINLLRVVMRRVFGVASEEEQDADTWFRALASLGLAAGRLANLLRTQHTLRAEGEDLLGVISQAIGEVASELVIGKSEIA